MPISVDQDNINVTIIVGDKPSIAVTEKGPKGDAGVAGATGATGATGPAGAAGEGLIAGGSENQFIQKNSATDYDTKWSAYTLPAADGTNRQVLMTDGAGTVSFAYPQTIAENVKNVSGGPLSKGTPVHVTGSVGNLAEVIAADAATNYPAQFVLDEDLANEGEGKGVVLGFINNVDVPDASIYTEGQTVYLGAAGGWVTSKPTGTNAIQNLGIIIKVNTGGNKISIIVMGAGRANDVPNIPQGYIWAGNSSGIATPTDTAYIDIANSRVGIGTTTPAQKLQVEGGLRFASDGAGGNYMEITRSSNNQWKWDTLGVGEIMRQTGNLTTWKQDFRVERTGLTVAPTLGYATSAINIDHTWNSVTTNFATIDIDVIDTASSGNSSFINIAKGGTTGFIIDENFNVGIGTTSPTETLQIGTPASGSSQPDHHILLTGYDVAGIKWNMHNGWSKAKLTSDLDGNINCTNEGSIKKETSFNIGSSHTSLPENEGRVWIKNSGVGNALIFGRNGPYPIAAIRVDSTGGAGSYFGGLTFNVRESTSVTHDVLTLEKTGKVGIGTATPEKALQVTPSLLVGKKGFDNPIAGQLRVASPNTSYGEIGFTSQYDILAAGIRSYAVGETTYERDLRFYIKTSAANANDGVEMMRIDSAGNVGIGTTTPTAKVHIDSGADNQWELKVREYGRIGWDGGVTQYMKGWSRRIAFHLNGIVGEAGRFSSSGDLNRLVVKRAIHLGANSSDNGDVRFTRLDVGKVAIGNSADDASGTIVVDTVGIGTTTPSEKLTVDGNIFMSEGSKLMSETTDPTHGAQPQSLEFYLPYRADGVTMAENKSALKLGGSKFFEPRTTNGSVLHVFGSLSVVPTNSPDRGGSFNIGFGSSADQYPSTTISLGGWGSFGSTTDRHFSSYGYFGVRFEAIGARYNTDGQSLGEFNTTGLGIGTNSPTEKLHVVGKANINDGNNNVLISTGNSTITASNTTAVGYQALKALTTGAGNTAVGYQAGNTVTTGINNTILGYSAGGTNNSYTTLVGYDANANGNYGVAIGWLTRAGEFSTSIGTLAGANSSTATYNVYIGDTAGRFNNGHRNVFIGRNAGGNSSTASDSVFIGYRAGYNETSSNKLYIENSNSSTPLIYGEFDNDIVRVNGELQVGDPASTGFKLPTADGTANQVLQTNGSGVVSWATVSGGGAANMSQTFSAPTNAGEFQDGARLVINAYGAAPAATAGTLVSFGNTNVDAVGAQSTAAAATGMLTVVTDAASADELLVEGVVKMSSNTGWSTAKKGAALYMSTTAGAVTTTAPSTAGEFVRVVGHVVDATNSTIYFKPDNTWLEL